MDIKKDDLLPILTCTSTKCEDDLHCFRPKKKTKPEFLSAGHCHACNADLIDWSAVHKRDLKNLDGTILSLKKEYLRNVIWNEALETQVKEDYRCKLENRTAFKQKIIKELNNSIGKPGRELFRDGQQTPLKTKNLIHLARHATATCCRKCVKYWHDIPYDENLNATHLDYFSELVLKFIESKLLD